MPGSIGDIFQHLPSTLLHLEILNASSSLIAFHAAELKKLPQNLQSSSFSRVLCNGLARWVHYLPRTLETLWVPYIPIIGCEIKDLPPKLTAIECPFFEVSLPQVLQLPRSLSTLAVRRSGGFQSTSVRHALTTQAWNVLISTYHPFWRVREAGLAGLGVELSLASKGWNLALEASHLGKRDFLLAPENYRSSSSRHDAEEDLKCGDGYGYTSEDVERYLVDSGADNLSIDPRTTRRVTSYL